MIHPVIIIDTFCKKKACPIKFQNTVDIKLNVPKSVQKRLMGGHAYNAVNYL